MKIQVETLALGQLMATECLEPAGPEGLRHVGSDPVRIGGQISGFGRDVQAGKQRQARIED